MVLFIYDKKWFLSKTLGRTGALGLEKSGGNEVEWAGKEETR